MLVNKSYIYNLTFFEIYFKKPLKRCESDKYFDTSDQTFPQCSKIIKKKYFYFNILFIFLLYIKIENRKSYGTSCSNVKGECDYTIGLNCYGTTCS
jgi:hypothetical protein